MATKAAQAAVGHGVRVPQPLLHLPAQPGETHQVATVMDGLRALDDLTIRQSDGSASSS